MSPHHPVPDGAMDRPLSAARRSRRRWWWLVLPAALGIAAVVQWPTASTGVNARFLGGPAVEGESLRYAAVERGPLTHEISVEARAVAAFRPTLYSPAVGIVTLHVAEGQSVDKGARLASIESPELDNRLEQERAQLAALESNHGRRRLLAQQVRVDHDKAVALAKLQLKSIQRELARSEDLSTKGLVRQDELEALRERLAIAKLEGEHLEHQGRMQAAIGDFEADDAQRQVERQQLVVQDLERRVAELNIEAPFQGMVAALDVENRDAVVSGQALLGLVDLTKLELEVRIPEAYAPEVAVGTAARISVNNTDHPGQLTRVAPEVVGGEVLGRVAFEGVAPADLRQNQRVITRLVLGRSDDALHIPRGPYLQAGGRSIYVQKGSLLHRRDVRFGFVGIAHVEVLEGLEVGEQVVLNDLSQHDDVPELVVR